MKQSLIRRLTLLTAFSLILFGNVSKKTVTQTKADNTNKWTETSTITSGRHYIISAKQSEESSYYLEPKSFSVAPNGILIEDIEDLTLSAAWTFISDDDGYIITSVGGHRLYWTGSSNIYLKAENTLNAIGTWTYSDGRLKYGTKYLGNFNDITTNSWRINATIPYTNYVFDLTLYEYNDNVSEEVTRFSGLMTAWLGNSAQGKCETFVPPLLAYYDSLSNDAKVLFNSDEQYSNQSFDLAYFMRWHESVTPTPPSDISGQSNEYSLILAALLSLLAVVSYALFLKVKRQKR